MAEQFSSKEYQAMNRKKSKMKPLQHNPETHKSDGSPKDKFYAVCIFVRCLPCGNLISLPSIFHPSKCTCGTVVTKHENDYEITRGKTSEHITI